MLELLGLIGIIVVLIIFDPFIDFIMGWITGWLISKTFAATFLAGLDLLGIALMPYQIPILCGVLNVIGGFFRSRHHSKKLDTEIDKIIDSF